MDQCTAGNILIIMEAELGSEAARRELFLLALGKHWNNIFNIQNIISLHSLTISRNLGL